MPMYITLKRYLTRLEEIESRKPEEERKHVPNLSELAKSLKMHQTSISRLANNQISQLNLDTGDRIISEMRRRGFSMQTTDLVEYRDH